MKNSILFKRGETAYISSGMFFFLFTFMLSINIAYAQPCSLVAEDQISAAVDENCEAVVTFDAVLDGSMTSCPGGNFVVNIYDGLTLVNSGNPAVIPSGYVGATLQAVVEDLVSGNLSNECIINVVDNLNPTLACFENLDETSGSISFLSPVYNRAADGSDGGSCSLAGFQSNAVAYDVFQFEVDANDIYTFDLVGSTFPPNGFFVALYEGAFDFNNACTNLLDTDFGATPGVTASLTAGSTYYLVTSVYTNFIIAADYNYSFVSSNAGNVRVAVPDCIYSLYSYENIDEKVVIEAYDNCGGADYEVVNEVPQDNDCTLGWPDDLLRIINRTYVATDLANPANESALLEVQIFVYKLPDALYYGGIHGPNDFLVANGNSISCDAEFESTVNGCCDETGFPVPGDVGGPGNPGVPFLDINGNITWLLTPDMQNNLAATFVDMPLNTPNPDCVSKVMRMWTVTEWGCSERPPRIFFQEIEVADTADPILVCPANDILTTNASEVFENTTNGTVYCGAEYTFPLPFATDNCQIDLEWNINIFNDNNIPIEFIPDVSWTSSATTVLPLGLNTIYYNVFDGCGNSAECSFTVDVQDFTPPVAICQQFTVVALTYDGEAEVPATSFDSGSYDDCQFDRVEVRRMEEGPDFHDYITFDCNDIGEDQVVVMRAYDIFQNWSECMVFVEVQDKLDPTIECPDNMTVDCDYFFEEDNLGAYFGEATAYDNCSVVITHDYDIDIDQCGEGSITRYFTATDPDGRTDYCEQRIVFENNHHFGMGRDNNYNPNNSYGAIEWPGDVLDIEGCIDPNNFASNSVLHPDQSGWPVLNEDACDLAGATYTDEIYVVNDNDLDNNGACFKVIRTWKVKDWCNRLNGVYVTWSHDQVLMVSNYIDPVFSRILPDTTTCTFDQTCVDGFISLTLSVTDECTQNEDMKWQYLIDEYNDDVIDVYNYTSPVYNGNSLDASGEYPIGTHRILWRAWDQCGNMISQEHLFTIMNCKKPTPICFVGLSTDLTQMPNGPAAMIDASFYNDNSYHTCNYPLAFSYSEDVNDNVRTYTCADFGINEVEMWVTAFLPDGSITQDYCVTEIDIQDNFDLCPDNFQFVNVSGMVYDENQNAVTGVNVALEGSEFGDEITDDSGEFAFPEMISGGSYELEPQLADNHSNGVSTLDLIHMQKHILGLQAIGSPYKMIAADVNKDQKISASDLLDTRKLILGVSQEFDNNSSWRFVNANYVFQNEANPLTEAYPESEMINNIQDDVNSQFVAVKVGDITNDASLNGLPVIEARSDKTLTFDLDTERLSASNVEIPVYANDFNMINGFQFTLEYDQKVMEFTGISSETLNLNSNNYHETTMGAVAISWSKAVAIDIADDMPLFTLNFNVNAEVELNEVLNISSAQTKAEAYDATLDRMNIELNYRNLEAGEYALYQNTPNPFSESTTISFNMKNEGSVSLSIFDLNGKLLKVINGDFAKGINAITINKKDLPVNGMLYYQLNADDFSASKKMILVK